MVQAIYHEARGEPIVGQIAVAQVIINRSIDPRWPQSICGVVRQNYQFSYLKERRDHRLHDLSARDTALLAAKSALYGNIDITEGATHYHADRVAPAWTNGMKRTVTINQHIFYRQSGVFEPSKRRP